MHIAIIGIGCRFPGANSASEYWQLLCSAVDALSPVPTERQSYRQKGVLGRVVQRGGFVGQIDEFDPYFFGLSPREGIGLDPQTRLLFESVWRAAEDAGITAPQLRAVRTGVFVGLCSDDYNRLIHLHAPDLEFQAAFGASRASGSGRISHSLRLTGPSITIDTACSSSLVSIHLAVRAIQQGDCEMAFAGGANALLSPETTVSFMRARLLSPGGRCEAFREGASGFVRSEGGAVVLVKALDRALADGDRIYAVIRGSSVNNDGGESLYMAPSVDGQIRVTRAAYADAGISPAEVDYVEAHGTGTRIGDPIETEALAAVLCQGRSEDRALRIGSCKANIGHLEAGAGVAGLIKAALAVYHAAIPPSLHADPLNNSIPWAERRIRVQQKLEPWPATTGPRVAAVNSFGITGTNAHVILTSAPAMEDRPSSESPALRVLPVSARDETSLKQLAAQWSLTLRNGSGRLGDMCYTASLRRTAFDHRLAILGRSTEEIAARLDGWIHDLSPEGVVAGRVTPGAIQGPVFVYSGIGSQWAGMAVELYDRNPVFRAAFDRIAKLFRDLSGIDLPEEIRRDKASSRIDDVRVMQPALFTLQIALTDVLKSWGIQPVAVVGHSLGEAAAACIAGALSPEDAARYVHVRSECLARTQDVGGMLALGVTPARAAEVIRGMEDRVAIGVVSSPESVVLSGDRSALNSIAAHFQGSDIFCRAVNASVATHSPLMNPFLPEIAQRISSLRPQTETIPFYSTVTGTRFDGRSLTPGYWVRNIRDGVLFGPAIEQLLKNGARSFVEISAHPLLREPIRQVSVHRSIPCSVLMTLKRNVDSEAALTETFCRLYASGYEVNWSALRDPESRYTEVPGHPFRREKLWLRDSGLKSYAEQSYARLSRPNAHALLPMRFDSADRPGTSVWQTTLDPGDHPFLAQHVVGMQPLLPFTTFVELAFAAAAEIVGPGPKTLRKMRFLKSTFLPPDEPVTLQTTLTSDAANTLSVAFHTRNSAGGNVGQWELICDALVSEGEPVPMECPLDLKTLGTRFPAFVSPERLLEIQELHGFHYGPLYRSIREGWRGQNEAVGRVEYLPVLRQESGFCLHPAFLDAVLHMPFVGYREEERPKFRLPVSIEEIHIAGLPTESMYWAYGKTEKGNGWERYENWLLADDGQPLIVVRGLLAKEFDPPEAHLPEVSLTHWMYESVWERSERSTEADDPGFWLIAAEDLDSAALLGNQLAARGHTFRIFNSFSKADDGMLANCASGQSLPWLGIVYFVPDSFTGHDPREYQKSACGGLLALIQAWEHLSLPEGPRLFVVSRGACRVLDTDQPDPALAPALGLARVAANEFASLRATVIDLEPGADSSELLIGELLSIWDGESEVAYRNRQRYVSRLSRMDPSARPQRSRKIRLSNEGAHSCRVVSPKPGVIENIRLELSERRAPGPGEIEIRVAAAGLNFLDVLRSLNLGPAQEPGAAVFGMECAGEVVRVGPGAGELRPGQRVLTMAAQAGCFQPYLTISNHLVFPLPPDFDVRSAAACLVAYQTAWYALTQVARIRRDEKILIHAAAGGVGLAAVHVARYLGAEVFATAGSQEKHAYLRELGIAHLMSSRTLDFADEVLRLTGGRGVDVVLNSISGEAIVKGLSALSMGGRFVEIGKRDIYANSRLELSSFRNNLSYHAVDLLGLMREREDTILDITREVLGLVFRGELPPLPYTEFPASRAQEAFRYMGQSKQIGKVLITFAESELRVEVPPDRLIPRDAAYLITGGLSGLGLLCAQWLASRGSQNIILLGRRTPDKHAEAQIRALRESGVTVSVASADVSNEQELRQVLHTHTRIGNSALPPLRGVIHAAGVLRDGVVSNLTWPDFEEVFASKVHGAANLAAALQAIDLDFFVLFSSIASTLASPGQGAYAAANSFLDALGDNLAPTHPSLLRINWGPWTGTGMLEKTGLRPAPMFGENGIVPEQGIAALDLLVSRDCASAVVMPANWRVWRETLPQIRLKPYFARMRDEMGEQDGNTATPEDLCRQIASLSEMEGRECVRGIVRDAVMKVLRIPEERMDNTIGLQQLGLDSLMGVELANRIRMGLGVALNLMKLLRGPSVDQLADMLYQDLRTALIHTGTASSDFGSVSSQVDQLSDAEVDLLLQHYAQVP